MLTNPAAPDEKSTIKFGEYIVLQRGNFMKIHQLSKNCCVMLGRDKIDLTSIIGKKYWSNFKMVHKKGSKREFVLVDCDKSESLLNLLDKDVRGIDNRDIWDDGSSQAMSAEEIIGLRDKGYTGQDIVEHLLENSKTFHCKTEYSQQKYLKKKEKKYFEYVIVHRPNIRIIAQILYCKDPQKVLNLRIDTLSQIVSAVNLQPAGNYIVFESGCQGIVSALMLNQLGGNGNLIHLYPNMHYQKHAVLAMNFSQKELNSFISIRLSAFMNKMFATESSESKGPQFVGRSDENSDLGTESVSALINTSSSFRNAESAEINCQFNSKMALGKEACDAQRLGSPIEHVSPIADVTSSPMVKEFNENKAKSDNSKLVTDRLSDEEKPDDSVINDLSFKRKLWQPDGDPPLKKFKWELEVDKAVSILSTNKADGLIIICKEYPIYLINRLIKLVALSRNIIIYSMFQEPIVKLYCELKLRKDVIALKLTESFLRNYQVLPDRTHPEINMSSSGGFLLTATVVSPEESAPF